VLRIGFDGRALASPAAGMRRYAQELFRALALLDPSLAIVAVGTPAGVSVPVGIEVGAGAKSLPTNFGWMLTGLPRAARRARLDLFHAPSYTAPVGGPRPLVLTIHDISYERNPEWYPYKRDPVRRAFYRYSARSADRVITDSEFSRREILDVYALPPDSVAVVPLAAAPTFREGPPLPLPYGWPTQYILHVGDLHARRNLPMLARAVAAVRSRKSAWSALGLVLAGVDRGTATDLQQVNDRSGGSAPLVTFTGMTTEPQLLALYRSAAALAYPSRYEGFGLPLLEAMACGTPVIAARTSSIPEVVGDASVLLDPDDEGAWIAAIERLLEDGPHRARLRDAGLGRARDFSWRRTAEETARVYRALIKQPGGRP
jgi:glycosyltransferase involved in cell wall biosynthesis